MIQVKKIINFCAMVDLHYLNVGILVVAVQMVFF